MKGYFAYIRVSTVRQGEKGSSLQEQKTAIERYALRQNLTVSEWFEEQETAAKLGRPIFTQMLRALDGGKAVGVITHKIDRSARNLRDWAALGELVDRGVELHFAHESIDLSSRGGRLSADIQAVVAADYIRNLRDEVRKGFYGRLNQGLYPLHAPLGYLDMGGGQVKAIDPLRGPLVVRAFDLYATGHWSLDALSQELHTCGLRTRHGQQVSTQALSKIFHNPFYTGLIRVISTGEVFQGRHSPLISKFTFDQVQAILSGRFTHRGIRRRFRYQRMLRCATCGYALIAEHQKSYVYYRCHTNSCPPTSIREEKVDDMLRAQAPCFALTDEEWDAVRHDIDVALDDHRTDAAQDANALKFSLSAIDDRLGRLTDAFVDHTIDRESYLQRKEKLLGERVALQERIAAGEVGADEIRTRVEKILELLKSLGIMPILENDAKFRSVLENTTSNFTVDRKNVAIAWKNPFQELSKRVVLNSSGHSRIGPRTSVYRVYVEVIIAHCIQRENLSDADSISKPRID
jgi:DNA invertase Pin-like site-specific DNA recombinase